MTLHEIARRLYHPHWADEVEYAQALRNFARLSPEEMEKLEEIGRRFDDRVKRGTRRREVYS